MRYAHLVAHDAWHVLVVALSIEANDFFTPLYCRNMNQHESRLHTVIPSQLVALSKRLAMGLEAHLQQAVLLKKVVDAMKDLCKDVNFDCSEKGLHVQSTPEHQAQTQKKLQAEKETNAKAPRR